MRKILSTILYLTVGLPMVLSALLLFSVKPWVTDRNFYKKALADDRLYTALSNPDSWKNADPVTVIDGYSFDTASLVSAVQKDIPVAEIKALAARAVDEAFDEMGPAPKDKSIDLDMTALRKRVSASIPAIARRYAAALPERKELPAPTDLSYRPASLTGPQSAAAVQKAMTAALDTVPATVSWPVEKPEIRREGLVARFILGARSLGSTATRLAIASAFIIGALAFLGERKNSLRLRRAGNYILFPSILVLLGGAILYLPGAPLLRAVSSNEMRALLSGGTGSALASWIASVLGPMAKSLFITGLVGTSIGGALISSKRILEPKED